MTFSKTKKKVKILRDTRVRGRERERERESEDNQIKTLSKMSVLALIIHGPSFIGMNLESS